MFEARAPKYPWGLKVSAVSDLLNDGSHPETAEGSLLVPQGTVGEIVQIGHHEEANVPVYIVEFALDRPCVVGVVEEEIAPA